MARKVTPQTPQAPAQLLRPREDVRSALADRVALGNNIVNDNISSRDGLAEADAAYRSWSEYNSEFLARVFSTNQYQIEYNATYSGAVYINPDFGRDVRQFNEKVRTKIRKLESLSSRLELIDEAASIAAHAQPNAPAKPRLPGKAASGKHRVFIVHGRDDELKVTVARFVERCGLEAVILHEQADEGLTIIEKFEKSSDVSFAIVLLSSDDVGGLKGPDGQPLELAGRARQNVIFELGFFIGALGRQRVFALKRGDVELPSDYAGIVYTPYDVTEGWKLKLVRELKTVGIEVDMAALV